VAVAKKKDQAVESDMGDLEFWNPASLTCFDFNRLKQTHDYGPVVYAISSKDIKALSFATIHLISSATVVITDDEIGLQELLQNFVDAFKAQKHQ
jgi:hypothetical protein